MRKMSRYKDGEILDIKVVLFDCFGTVFDMSGVGRDEVSEYVRNSRGKHGDEWQPLDLPKTWETIPAHSDSVNGIAKIREAGHYAVALSNGPAPLIATMSRNAGIVWDLIIPLELVQAYKNHPDAYRAALKIFPQFEPKHFLMVTANPDFGDVEAAGELGMSVACVRNHHPNIGKFSNILQLSFWLWSQKLFLRNKDNGSDTKA